VAVSGEAESGPQRTGCYLCGRPTYDPDKRSRPWARAAVGGRQVLVCPVCQQDRPDWDAALDRCVRCGSTRLSAMLGEVVCRACGAVQAEATDADADAEEPNFTGA
jgi:predicted amidophosphoribosyltransferase